MIVGLGLDLVHVPRIHRAIQRFGPRFLERVFTEAESAFCLSRPDPGACLALRFAAKEAFSKALGVGMRQGLRWKDMETLPLATGRPTLKTYGKATALIAEQGIQTISVSLSDDGDYACAVVILES
jgi:holo-[acyl-carrier protein] synthase